MFAATRSEPAWIGAAIAVVGLTLAAIGAVISGRMALVVELGPAVLFTGRDPRNLIVFVIMFAYVVTARRYVLLGGLRAFDALGPVLVAQPGLELESLRSETVERPTDARVRRRRALMTLAIAPLVAFAIDRDPSLYFLPEYWNYERTAQWGAGLALCWNLGLLIDATLECGRRFDSLARRLERVDLLRLDLLAPFADLGMRIALVWLLIAALFALNLVDAGYLSSVIALAVLSLGLATAGVLPPVLGARARVRDGKRAELERIKRALNGEAGALRGSTLEARAETVSISDLLAYHDYVAALPEWPFDASMQLRFLLYIAIPVGSWVGGAFVEQLLESTLA